MFKRKFLVVIAILMLLAMVGSPAFAQARYGVRISASVEVPTDAVLPAGTWVYGWKIFADDTNSTAGIFDAIAAVAQGTVTIADLKGDIGEATQYDSKTEWFPVPIFFANGVSIKMTTGIVWIYYGPHPNA